MNIEKLLRDVLEQRVQVKDLSEHEHDAVIFALEKIAVNLLDTEHDEMAQALLDILTPLADAIQQDHENKFEAAIQEAESRGCVYFEFEEPIIH
jgi:truncated hemoglobin YjbI